METRSIAEEKHSHKSHHQDTKRRGFFPEGAFNVRVASDPPPHGFEDEDTDQSDNGDDNHPHEEVTASTAYKNSSTSTAFDFRRGAVQCKATPSKWDDADKWLLKSSKKNGNGNSGAGFHVGKKVSCKVFNSNGGHSSSSDSPSDRSSRGSGVESTKKMDTTSNSRFSFPHLPPHARTARSTNQNNLSEDHHAAAETEDFLIAIEKQQRNSAAAAATTATLRIQKPGEDNASAVRAISMRDMGTEMTPIASQEPSRTGTPIIGSPGRTNSMAPCSPTVDSADQNRRPQLQQQQQQQQDHVDDQREKMRKDIAVLGNQLGKSIKLQAAAWATREEEEEDASKSLKSHAAAAAASLSASTSLSASAAVSASTAAAAGVLVDLGEARRNALLHSRAAAWEEAEQAKYMARYEREEAKIIAWENHQKAKAEAELRRTERSPRGGHPFDR